MAADRGGRLAGAGGHERKTLRRSRHRRNASSKLAESPGEAGPSWSRGSAKPATAVAATVRRVPKHMAKRSATTVATAVDTTVAKSAGEARPLGIAKNRATTAATASRKVP